MLLPYKQEQSCIWQVFTLKIWQKNNENLHKNMLLNFFKLMTIFKAPGAFKRWYTVGLNVGIQLVYFAIFKVKTFILACILYSIFYQYFLTICFEYSPMCYIWLNFVFTQIHDYLRLFSVGAQQCSIIYSLSHIFIY